MKRRFFTWSLVAVPAALGGVLPCRRARAELSVGMGNLAPPTQEGSARLNAAFSAFYSMMEHLDRRLRGPAAEAQQRAISLMYSAADPFREAAAISAIRELNPIAENDQERAEVAYFNIRAATYNIRLPVTQRDLVAASSRIAIDLGNTLRSADMGSLLARERARQDLVARMAEVKLFLVSVTTVLRITS